MRAGAAPWTRQCRGTPGLPSWASATHTRSSAPLRPASPSRTGAAAARAAGAPTRHDSAPARRRHPDRPHRSSRSSRRRDATGCDSERSSTAAARPGAPPGRSGCAPPARAGPRTGRRPPPPPPGRPPRPAPPPTLDGRRAHHIDRVAVGHRHTGPNDAIGIARKARAEWVLHHGAHLSPRLPGRQWAKTPKMRRTPANFTPLTLTGANVAWECLEGYVCHASALARSSPCDWVACAACHRRGRRGRGYPCQRLSPAPEPPWGGGDGARDLRELGEAGGCHRRDGGRSARRAGVSAHT